MGTHPGMSAPSSSWYLHPQPRLRFCWDEAWDKLCKSAWHKKPGNCFMLMSDSTIGTGSSDTVEGVHYPATCTATCNSYGIPVTGCDEIFSSNGCPGAGAKQPEAKSHKSKRGG